MQHDWFMYHLRSTYKNRLDFPFKTQTHSGWREGGGGGAFQTSQWHTSHALVSQYLQLNEIDDEGIRVNPKS